MLLFLRASCDLTYYHIGTPCYKTVAYLHIQQTQGNIYMVLVFCFTLSPVLALLTYHQHPREVFGSLAASL